MINQENEWIISHIDTLIDKVNNLPHEDFEGYSPYEMGSLLNFLNDPRSPLKINVLSDKAYKEIPLLNQTCLLMSILEEQENLLLTKVGNLPPKWVKALYVLGPPELAIEMSSKNVIKEQDTIAVQLARIILKIYRLCKQRHNKLSLTHHGKKLLNNKPALLHGILHVLTYQFNWGYFDGYGNFEIGQLGFGFTLVLLAKYGDKPQPAEFYADKYFKAFPQLLIDNNNNSQFRHNKKSLKYCYYFRNFDRYLSYLGLVNITKVPSTLEEKYLIQKTPLFDQLITVVAPQGIGDKV
ncbi:MULTISPECIES: hypothetical protein [unclassified Gilliamella]|uniref:hypothetical protein n=1 Tax=unclassified Gilliamella TaxID=2685620 RepID=UPI0013062361|nr:MULTISPECIES: hypothetical protein [unclassified Gilliamella]MWP48686.1 hypothetical protein [Gilliamella sp. Lep-s35]MWP68497.1 hypothetical protein [Gilliamella sp. Lep-s5]MWP76957.1 hypothetical protein [Gilliamella sp. Lep-s21]